MKLKTPEKFNQKSSKSSQIQQKIYPKSVENLTKQHQYIYQKQQNISFRTSSK